VLHKTAEALRRISQSDEETRRDLDVARLALRSSAGDGCRSAPTMSRPGGIRLAYARIDCILPGDMPVPRRPRKSIPMATMRFSVPDEVRDRFEEAFREHDRSVVVTGLLLLAVEAEERRRRQSLSLVERLRRVGNGGLRAADGPIRRTTLRD
jgi:hypothetical protein